VPSRPVNSHLIDFPCSLAILKKLVPLGTFARVRGAFKSKF
jgi:hypothetical protein